MNDVSEAQQANARGGAIDNSAAPLIAHIIYRFDIGGMENGLVNLINRMPADRYRHVIICLTEFTEFRRRLNRQDVACFALHKREGKDFPVYARMWRLLRRLRPDIVHTRNLPALDSLVAAALAGVHHRVHGEHGRDVTDMEGTSRKYTLLRRALRSFAHRYIALSRDLEQWLREQIGVPSQRIALICNGVDAVRFHPTTKARAPLPAPGFGSRDLVIIGSVLRFQPIKDPLNLVRAFALLIRRAPRMRDYARLALIGDGPLYQAVEQELQRAGLRDLVWLAGSRDDVPELMRALDIFVLPSQAEGISNTILEAMATGLPIVATDVGGNSELVVSGETGTLVPRADPESLAHAMRRYIDDRALAQRHGKAGRRRVELEFSLDAMVRRYLSVYDALLAPSSGRVTG